MNKSDYRHDVLVGLFVLIGIGILVTGVLLIGSFNEKFENKIKIFSFCDDVGGLQKGNYIWFSGVRIGTVKSLEFFGPSHVKVTMGIDKKVTQYISNDARIKLGSDALIGNKILIVYGGSETAPKVKEGDTLKFETTLSSEEMINTLQENNENLKVITANFKILSNKLVKGEGSIGKLLNDDSLYANLNTTIVSLKNASLKAQQIVSSLSSLSSGLNREGTLGKELATDTVIFKSIKSTVLRLQQIGDTATLFLSTLKQAGDNPDTPFGVLLHDKETGSDLKETIRNLNSSSQKLDEDLKAMQNSFLLRRYFKKKENAENKSNSFKNEK
jgi:phospholipid/cholesterol/gamma-HCH transport system substrate-binding protein